MSDAAQPFAGLNVVEFGQFVAVPFCAQLLAEGGANVVKIEALEGDPTRKIMQLAPMETRTFISRNRGKHSLPLALRDPNSRPVIDALLAWADVALMNFRPGLAEQLGLDGETLTAQHPRLIVGAVTAFGKAGPDATYAGMDIVVQARTGLMAANGRIVDGRPAPGDPVSADYMCAMSLAFGVTAALLRREQTGKGGVVDTSLMQAAMTLANNQLTRSDHDLETHAKVLDQLAEQRAAGVPFAEQAQSMPTGRSTPLLKVYFRTYQTADGHVAIACGSHGLRVRFIDALGMADHALDTITEGDWTDHYEALRVDVEAHFASQPSSHWMKLLNNAGVPVSTVKFPVELFDDPQPAANAMFHRLEHPSVGPMQVLSPPVRLDAEGFQAAPPTPTFGTETDSILASLGFEPDAIDALVDANVTHRGVTRR